jgi:hypothetical protein
MPDVHLDLSLPELAGRRSSQGKLLDAGCCNIRGGPMFDRDESFQIYSRPEGFLVDSWIQSTLGEFEFRCCFEFDEQWLPRRVAARGRSGDTRVDVSICADLDAAHLTFSEADGSAAQETLEFARGHLLDLEPSVIPMWAMTRRYDQQTGGEQSFFWAGRSLTRGFALQGGRTDIHLTEKSGQGDSFKFTEVLTGPDGAPFHVNFELENDVHGWLQGFTVRTPKTRVRGQRRRPVRQVPESQG